MQARRQEIVRTTSSIRIQTVSRRWLAIRSVSTLMNALIQLQNFGRTIVAKLNDIKTPVDIVDVFRPSKETPMIAEEAIKIGAKVFWLQYGIQNDEAKKIVETKNIFYVSNKCIKQEYQRLFLKISPVFPALKN